MQCHNPLYVQVHTYTVTHTYHICMNKSKMLVSQIGYLQNNIISKLVPLIIVIPIFFILFIGDILIL